MGCSYSEGWTGGTLLLTSIVLHHIVFIKIFLVISNIYWVWLSSECVYHISELLLRIKSCINKIVLCTSDTWRCVRCSESYNPSLSLGWSGILRGRRHYPSIVVPNTRHTHHGHASVTSRRLYLCFSFYHITLPLKCGIHRLTDRAPVCSVCLSFKCYWVTESGSQGSPSGTRLFVMFFYIDDGCMFAHWVCCWVLPFVSKKVRAASGMAWWFFNFIILFRKV